MRCQLRSAADEGIQDIDLRTCIVRDAGDGLPIELEAGLIDNVWA